MDMSSHSSKHSPDYYEHVLLLDGERVRVVVDLNWIGSIDFSSIFCNLFAIQFDSEATASRFEYFLADREEHTRIVGKVLKDGKAEVFAYSRSQNLFNEVDLQQFTDLILDCFVTCNDCGRFYRSFLLPIEFKDLSVSYVTMVTEFEITGRPCTMIVLSTMDHASQKKDFIDRLTSLGSWITVDAGTNSVAFRLQVESLDMVAQHRDLTRLYKLSIELGYSLSGVEFDLR